MTATATNRTIVAAAVAVGLFGISYGVLATTAGFTVLEVITASLTIFAGSSQFAALATTSAGGSAAAAVAAALALNLRYLPFGVATAPDIPGRGIRRIASAHLVIDESVVMASRPDGTFDGPTLLKSGAALFIGWVIGTAVGAIGGDFLGDPLRLGLDAAFPALFLALLAPRLRTDGRSRMVAVLGAVITLATIPLLPAGVPVALSVFGVAAAWSHSRPAGPAPSPRDIPPPLRFERTERTQRTEPTERTESTERPESAP